MSFLKVNKPNCLTSFAAFKVLRWSVVALSLCTLWLLLEDETRTTAHQGQLVLSTHGGTRNGISFIGARSTQWTFTTARYLAYIASTLRLNKQMGDSVGSCVCSANRAETLLLYLYFYSAAASESSSSPDCSQLYIKDPAIRCRELFISDAQDVYPVSTLRYVVSNNYVMIT
jgi:hypothetical protein